MKEAEPSGSASDSRKPNVKRTRAILALLLLPTSITAIVMLIQFGDFGNRLVSIISAVIALLALVGVVPLGKPKSLGDSFEALPMAARVGVPALSLLACGGIVWAGIGLSGTPPSPPVVATQNWVLADSEGESTAISPTHDLQLKITEISPPSSRVLVRVGLVDENSNSDCIREVQLLALPQFSAASGGEGQSREVRMSPVEASGDGRPVRNSDAIAFDVPGRLTELTINFHLNYYSACDLRLNISEVTSSVSR